MEKKGFEARVKECRGDGRREWWPSYARIVALLIAFANNEYMFIHRWRLYVATATAAASRMC